MGKFSVPPVAEHAANHFNKTVDALLINNLSKTVDLSELSVKGVTLSGENFTGPQAVATDVAKDQSRKL